jgi:hypothetical protein
MMQYGLKAISRQPAKSSMLQVARGSRHPGVRGSVVTDSARACRS